MLLNKLQSNKIYTIAEMSGNHNGSYENAIKIIRAAKQSGADCLKIQTYTADSLTIDCDSQLFKITGGLWDGYHLYDLYKQAATPYEWQTDIKAECDRIGIDFLSTPFDEAGADFLEKLGVRAYKVASFELVHIPLIRHIAKKGKPMIVSCGMGSIDEISEAVEAMLSAGLTREQIILLKCTSEYPAAIEDMNLSTIADMKQRFNVRVGLSDHSMGYIAPVISTVFGACIVEKHFCLDRGLGGVDSAFSMEPKEFADMVDALSCAQAATGSVAYGCAGREADGLLFRRSIFAVGTIKKGELFNKDNIKIIRPSNGAKPKYYDEILGRKSDRDYAFGEPVIWNG